MVTKSAKRVASFLGTSALTRPLFALGAASALLGAGQAQALDANTLPQNPNVVGGKDSFAQSGNTLNVNQSTKRTVIDWRSFDIGSKAQVNFNQPGTSAIAVNRVNSSANATQIEGGLHANGQVWILNPNGVFFGKGAHVDAAGIVASTANIDTNAFMAGSNKLQMTGADHGSVENQGNISVGANGLAAFVAPSVRNSGVINATVGKVALAAGTTYTLDLAGDHLVELGLGSVKAVVDNSGRIVNPGGTIALTAKAAGQVVSSVVNVSGVVSASSVSKSGGTITLGGDNINTTATAQLSADAGTNGNGGSITSVANNQGNYAGSFSAKGGSASGNGGSVETSGKSVTVADGISVDTRAPNGILGNWTVDPININIVAGGDDGDTVGSDGSISTGTIEHALNTTSLTITTDQTGGDDGDINLESSINAAGTGALTLTGRHLYETGGSTISLAGALTLNVNAVNTLADTSTSGNWINDALGMVGGVTGGTTINLGAGTYAAGTSITKNNVTIDGGNRLAKISVAAGQTGVTIDASNVTLEGLEIAGPVVGDQATITWSDNSWGVQVTHATNTNVTIDDNDIHNLRTGILIANSGNPVSGAASGSITNNLIEDTKGGVLVQYRDGSTFTISGNSQGQYGNEWGIVTGLQLAKISSDPSSARQTQILNWANANNGMTVLDRQYATGNRSAVIVDASGTATAADDFGLGNGVGNERQPINNIQAGISAVVAGGTVNVNDGTYTISSGYINVNKSLNLIGESEDGVIIDATNASTYGLRVTATNDVKLENFTLWGVKTGSSTSGYGLKAEATDGLTIENVTSRGAYKSEFDLNGVTNGTLVNLTADGAPVSDAGDSTTSGGNGISFTNSQNITLTDSHTRNNAWGGLALYQSTTYGNLQLTGITVDGSNTFSETNGIYAEDQSSVTDIGTVDLSGQGITYIAQALVAPNDFYTWFQTSKQGAINAAAAVSSVGYVQGYAGDVSGDGTFTVGTSTNGTAMSIQAAVNAAAAGATINVGDGTYTGDVTIAKSGLKLLSENGSGSTTIQGVAGTSAEGAIFLKPGSDNTQIGDVGHGFTIAGFDSANPGVENAAVYVQGANSGSSLIGNHITANGDEAILTEYNAAVTNLTIDHNLIDGTTFTGTNAASGNQFTVPNVARGLVYISGGSGVTNTQNIHFTNNDVTGTTGGPNGNSNYLVTIDAVGADISGNTFAGTVTGTSAQLRTRGTATNISGNTFDDANLGSSANAVEILNQAFTGADASDDTFAEVLAGNAFNNGSVWLDHSVGGSWYVGVNIGNAVAVASPSDTVHVGSGNYTLPGELDITKSLTLDGAGVGVTNITSNSTGYGINVTADNVSLQNFTYHGPTGTGSTYGIKVTPDTGVASDRLLNFDIENVTIDQGYRTGLDLNGVDGATIKNVSVSNIVHGNGIALTDSADVTITGSTTSSNAWGGLALYQTNTAYDQQTNNIVVDGTNTFNDTIPVYAEDQSDGISANGHPSVVGGSGLDFGSITLAGFDYVVQSPNTVHDVYSWFQKTEPGAIDFATNAALSNNNLNLPTATVQGYSGSGVNGNNVFYVGTGTNSVAMSIAAANAAASNGATIDVLAGTYTLPSTLTIGKSLSLVGAGEGATTIDGSGMTFGNAMRVEADNVSLGGFTLETSVNGFNGISVSKSSGFDGNGHPLSGQGVKNFSIANVTINEHAAGFSGLTLTGVEGAAVNHVTVDNGGSGNAIQIADSANVVLTNNTTSNADFGFVIVQNGDATSERTTGVSADTSNSFGAALAPVSIIDVSTAGPGMGALDIEGFALAIGTPQHLELHNGLQGTIDRAAALDATNSFIEGWTGTGVNNTFTVGTSTGGTALSVNTAIGAASTGGIINVNSGTYAEDVTDATQLAFNFGDVNVNSFTLASGGAGSSLNGNLNATGAIALNGSSTVAGNLTAGSIATTAPFTLIGNATSSGAVSFGGTTGVTGNVQGATIATTGPLTLVGNATASGGVTFGGVTSVTGNVKGSAITANNTLALNGSATASGAITANGAALLSGNLTGGSIALNGATTLTGNTTLDTSAANGAISTASVDGTTAGGQSLGINAGTGTVSLGDLGAATRLGAVSDASNTTLTGSTYNANSFLFGGDVTLTSADTTLNTTQSASAAGDITFQGDLFGTTDAAQSLTLIAGPGTGAASANGNITLQNAGTSAVYLNDLTVSGNDFTALTVDVGGDYNALLTGNQVFAADTLNVRGNASSIVGGDASGHIVAGGDVTIAAGGDISGTISGQNVNLTGDDVNSVVTATNAANIKGNTVEGSYTANTVTLIASNNVDAAVDATDFTLAANHGSVDGNWVTINTDGSNVVSVNGQTTVGLANVNPNQLVVEGFVLPAGTRIGANGQLILPQGVLLGLLSPGGGKPKMILVHSVQQLGELLAGGYSVIVIDLSNRDSGKPIQLASN